MGFFFIQFESYRNTRHVIRQSAVLHGIFSADPRPGGSSWSVTLLSVRNPGGIQSPLPIRTLSSPPGLPIGSLYLDNHRVLYKRVAALAGGAGEVLSGFWRRFSAEVFGGVSRGC